MSFPKSRRRRPEKSEWCGVKSTGHNTSSLKEGATSQELYAASEAGKGQAVDSQPEPPEATQPWQCLDCSPVRPMSDLQNCEIIKFCYFKPLCLLYFVKAAMRNEYTLSLEVPETSLFCLFLFPGAALSWSISLTLPSQSLLLTYLCYH